VWYSVAQLVNNFGNVHSCIYKSSLLDIRYFDLVHTVTASCWILVTVRGLGAIDRGMSVVGYPETGRKIQGRCRERKIKFLVCVSGSVCVCLLFCSLCSSTLLDLFSCILKGFWRWCVTLRMTGFLDFIRRYRTTFRILELFPSSGEEGDRSSDWY
jgi:hypothetical protein